MRKFLGQFNFNFVPAKMGRAKARDSTQNGDEIYGYYTTIYQRGSKKLHQIKYPYSINGIG